MAIDTFSRFYELFENGEKPKALEEDNKKRFLKWTNNFVFTNENKIYKNNKKKLKISHDVWRLRNSFIHFYSFPRPEKNKNRINFYFNVDDKEIDFMEKELKKKTGEKIVLIDIYLFIEAVFEGILLHLETFVGLINNNRYVYTNSVVAAHKIVRLEGTTTISFNSR